MDLPHDTPAGSETVPALAANGEAVSGGFPAAGREKATVTPVMSRGEPTHAGRMGRTNNNSVDLRSIWGMPFVLRKLGPAAPLADSTRLTEGRRETGAATSSPDAQGRRQ
jgi:hypothetical protein